jgi:hypothetical protein
MAAPRGINGSVGQPRSGLDDHNAFGSELDGPLPAVDRNHSRKNVNAGRKAGFDKRAPARLSRLAIGVSCVDQNGLVVRVQVSEPHQVNGSHDWATALCYAQVSLNQRHRAIQQPA